MHHAPASITDVSMQWPTVGEVWRTVTLQAGFNAAVVVAGTALLGFAAGVVGTFALLRKRALMGDALAHATLPGVALAFIVAAALGAGGKSLAVLLPGAALTGVAGVICVQLIVRHTRLTEDAAIGAVLSVFFGAGVVLLSWIQTMPTGGQAGLATFIYGQTAAMTVRDAVLMGAVAVIAAAAATLLFKEFALVAFDDAFARVQGWPVSAVDLAMMSLVVLVTVIGLQAVGLILVVAMLIIPAAAARFWTERLWRMTLIAGIIGALSGHLGASASALLPRLPVGSVIVLVSGAVFVVSMFAAPARGVVAGAARAARLRAKIARDHMLLEVGRLSSAGPGAVRINQIARARGWGALTAWLTARSLVRRGLARVRDGEVTLTGAGRAATDRLARTRALWEAYLTRYADVAPSHVDYSADLVEHILSPEIVAELESTLPGRDAPPEGAAA